jgi:hypothetical protein
MHREWKVSREPMPPHFGAGSQAVKDGSHFLADAGFALLAQAAGVSDCKTTTHRVKGRGHRRDGDNAEAMMALASLDDSRAWQTYWTTSNPARN